MTIDLDHARQFLLEEREKLVRQLKEFGADENGDLLPDFDFGEGFADAAAITSERTEALGLIESLKHHLEEVDAATLKLDEGTYGVCESCGEDIGAARMAGRPMSRYCMDCKTRRTA